MAELLARIRVAIRRRAGSAAPLLSNGIVSLDPATREAAVDGHAPVPLSNREFALLRALLVRPGAILSRREARIACTAGARKSKAMRSNS